MIVKVWARIKNISKQENAFNLARIYLVTAEGVHRPTLPYSLPKKLKPGKDWDFPILYHIKQTDTPKALIIESMGEIKLQPGKRYWN